MFHKHSWKVVKQREQPSPIEVIEATGITRFKGGLDSWNSLARRSVIVTRQCTKCGTEEVKRV